MFTGGVLRVRWPLLGLVAVLSALLGLATRELRLETRNEIWFVEGDRSLELMHKFEELFGNDDFVYVVFESDDFFQPEIIEKLRALGEDLEANVPHLLDVTWLGNAEYVEGFEDRVEISELIATTPESAREIAALKRKALAEPLYVNSLISPDARVAGLLLEMDTYPEEDGDPRKDVAPAVRRILAEPEYESLGLHAVGGPILDYDLDVLTARESARLASLCLLVQVVILFWVGRGARAVLVPVAVVALSVIWTFGMIALYGFGLNIFATMVPVLLVCVGIGDAMHVIAEFQDQHEAGTPRREALKRAMQNVGLPCVLTSLTTAAGFLSFLSARIKPFREMGIYTATGVAVAVLLTFVLVPVLYSWGPRSPRRRGDARTARNDVFDRWLAFVHRTVVRRRNAVIAVFGVVLAVSAIGYMRVQVESNWVEMFSEDLAIRQAYDFVDARMGGSMSVEMMLETGQTEGVTDPDFLRRMDDLERSIASHPLTTKTMSALDILKQMRRAFHENRQEYYSIPETRDEASQFLLLYEMSGGEDREKYVTFNNDVARLTARTRSLDTKDLRRFLADVEGFARDRLAATAQVEFAGVLSWAKAMGDLIAQGQRRSFATAFAVIAIIMMAVLRSIPLGLISMIPNVFPVVVALGFMGLTGIYMDLATMTFSAIIIGVAVDDTIHFFVRFRREFERLGSYSEALRCTLSTVGRPITFTTLTLTVGFAVLAFSDISGLVKFGLLSGFAFTWALLADVFFAPALILLLRPLGPERAGCGARQARVV